MRDNKGFTLVELIVVIVILAILVGATIIGVYKYTNVARVNTDINNASTLNSALSSLCDKPEVIYWARKSDKTHIITWSYDRKGLSHHGLGASYFIPSSDTEAGSFSNYSWAYLFQKYITYSQNTVDASWGGDTEKCLPQSRTRKGFVIVVTRDGEGLAQFHVYAMCDLTNSDIEGLIMRYGIIDEQVVWIRGKGGK